MREIVSTSNPSRVVEVGLAGGLVEGLKTGDLVVGSWTVSSVGNDRNRLPLDESLAKRAVELLRRHDIPVTAGGIVESPKIVALGSDKSALARATSALCVTMETAAIRTASGAVPHLALRVVFDPVGKDLDLPTGLIDADGRLRLGTLAGSVLRRPMVLGRLLRYGRWERQAFAALHRGLAVLEGLLLTPGPTG